MSDMIAWDRSGGGTAGLPKPDAEFPWLRRKGARTEEAFKGQLAPTKYLLEVAGVYPPVTDGSRRHRRKTVWQRLCWRG